MKLVSVPANPVPEDAIVGSIKTSDGVTLRYARFAPPPNRKGTVCIFPGRAEFIEKYFETVRDLRSRGFAVAILDWRGQGLSQRLLSNNLKGHVRRFDDYQLDLTAFMREIVLPDCPPPIFALGHSMGATVLLRAAHRGDRWFDRIVLSAPMIGLPNLRYSGAARVAATFLRMTGFGTQFVPRQDPGATGARPFIGNTLTSDPVRYARTAAILEAEPALGLGAPTVGWVNAAFKAMRDFSDPLYPASIRQPLLLVAAGRDDVVSTPAIEEFATYLRAGSHLIIAGAKHELLMELDRYRDQFLAAFDAFVPGTPLFGN